MIFGSLFSGIGGIDLGLERAGMRCAWQVEIDDFCQRVLAKHWPDVPRFRDVREVGAHNLSRVDLVAGGFPCQPFSSASHGRKRGTADARWLWPEMRRVVQALRPTWCLVENVPQFDGAGLEEMVSDLEGEGYQVAPPLEIPACAFGFDHWRARLWILSHAYSDSESGRAIHAKASIVPDGHRDAGGVGGNDGLPSRMDRLRALGNAVVPQVVEWIGRRIMKCAGENR